MASVQNVDNQQRIDLGQRLFLLGVFGSLIVELVGIFVNIGLSFEWTAFLLNAFAGGFIIYLGNCLYHGDKTALAVTRGWVTLMACVAGLGLACIWAGLTQPDIARHLGITAAWLGLLKLAAYATFACWLFVPGSVLDYFAARRGEMAAPVAPAEHLATTGTPVELTAEHTTALGGLAGAMKNASGVLLAVGFLDVAAGLLAFGTPEKLPAILNVIEGLAVMTLGCLLLAPTKAVQALVGAAQRHMGYVMKLLDGLQTLYVGYIVSFAVLAAVAVCRVVFKAM
jgi:hypothetical protein